MSSKEPCYLVPGGEHFGTNNSLYKTGVSL